MVATGQEKVRENFFKVREKSGNSQFKQEKWKLCKTSEGKVILFRKNLDFMSKIFGEHWSVSNYFSAVLLFKI